MLKKSKQKRKLIKKYELNKKKLIFKIEGIWTENLVINDEEIYKVKDLKRYKIVHETNVLPSDSYCREDLSLLKQGKIDEAQTAATKIIQQRKKDEKLRKAEKKK